MNEMLLLEIGTEEIPARFLPNINVQIKELTQSKFQSNNIPYVSIKVYSTPRRMALIVEGMATRQPDSMLEAKGPAINIAKTDDGEYSKAAQGFARSQKVELSDLVEREGYIYASKKLVGRPVAELLPAILTEIIHGLNFPKNMRWSHYETRFVRPIHWIVAMLNTKILPIEITDIRSSNFTYGHRFLSSGKIVLNHAVEYDAKLRENFVIVDQDERKHIIIEQIKATAAANNATIKIDEELLEEVIYLVEYPTALCGKFDKEFLALPKEAVITPMKEHQRYFPLFDKNGNLLPKFITVRNGNSNNIDVIAHGNARVLRARLSDANFFFTEDRKIKLDVRLEKLKTVVFQDGLGSMYDKVTRIKNLAVKFAQIAGYTDTAIVERTAHLAKADLATGMVYEFTELQGVMGREYAKIEGEPELVYEGIFEHYLPRFAGDILPTTPTGLFVGLADKIDNIVSTFSRGLIPTGSQDPYALRRQALGIVNILANSKYNLSLDKVLLAGCEALNITGDKQTELVKQISEFFNLRIKNMLVEQGLRYDLVDAILAMQLTDMKDVLARARTIKDFAQTAAFIASVQAFVRVSNLSKSVSEVQAIDPSKFVEAAEQDLYAAFKTKEQEIDACVQQSDYLQALRLIAELVAPINHFFDKVMVMDKDKSVKNNRLALLVNIRECVLKIVDFTKVVLG